MTALATTYGYPMAIDGDTAASALTRTFEYLFSTFPAPWFGRAPGVLGGVAGVPIALFNGIWADSVDPSRDAVADMLDQIAAFELPYCAQLRPGTSPEISDELSREACRLSNRFP